MCSRKATISVGMGWGGVRCKWVTFVLLCVIMYAVMKQRVSWRIITAINRASSLPLLFTYN